jgi:hypothetical protein
METTDPSPALPVLVRSALCGRRGGALKRLKGWRTGYVLPKEPNASAAAFVRRTAEEDLKERLEELHARLREAFGYRRKQLAASLGDGFAACRTPDFELEIGITIDPETPSRYLESLCVAASMDESLLSSEAFAAVFDHSFSEVLFEYSVPFDLAAVVDSLEEAEIPNGSLRYPPDLRRCSLEIPSEGLRILFEGRAMRFLLDEKPTIAVLGGILRKGRDLLKAPGHALLP